MIYRYKEYVFSLYVPLKTSQSPRLPVKPAVMHVKVPDITTAIP